VSLVFISTVLLLTKQQYLISVWPV